MRHAAILTNVLGLICAGVLSVSATAQTEYSTYLGGSSMEQANGIALDGGGNVYLTGTTDSTDFAGHPPVVPWHGAKDAFIAKLDASGAFLHWITYIGGSLDETGQEIAVDSSGRVYITGDTNSTDFLTTQGAFQEQGCANGDSDAFLVVVNGVDGVLLYSTYLGGSADDEAKSIALSPATGMYPEGTAYIGGWTESTDLPATTGAFNEQNTGLRDVFLVVLNPWAMAPDPQLGYCTYIGGGRDECDFTEEFLDIAVDWEGIVYLTGSTRLDRDYRPYFPTTAEAYRPTVSVKPRSMCKPGFITKLDPSGNGAADLVYSTYISNGKHPTLPRGIAVDDFGRAYVSGYTNDFFPTTAGAFDTSYSSQENVTQDAFVFILNTNVAGSGGLEYSSYFGGSGPEHPHTIAAVGATAEEPGDVILVGGARPFEPSYPPDTPVPFPVTDDAFPITHSLPCDAFLCKLRPGGNGAADLLFSTLMGGSGYDTSWNLTTDGAGGIYVAGYTDSSAGTFIPTLSPSFGSPLFTDALLVKFNLDGQVPPRTPSSPSPANGAPSVSVDADLGWNGGDANGGDTVTYEVRLSSSSPPVYLDTIGPLPATQTAITYDPGTLLEATTYYWQIVATDSESASTEGPIWEFTTTSGGSEAFFYATQDVPVQNGGITGSYSDTFVSDDVDEAIQERESGGKPSSRHSYLEHKWTIDVDGGYSTYSFHLEARRTANGEGDDFAFAYSTDDSTYTSMIVVNTSSDQVYAAYSLPGSLSGTVYIRVVDTDQTTGNRTKDTVFIDHMVIKAVQ